FSVDAAPFEDEDEPGSNPAESGIEHTSAEVLAEEPDEAQDEESFAVAEADEESFLEAEEPDEAQDEESLAVAEADEEEAELDVDDEGLVEDGEELALDDEELALADGDEEQELGWRDRVSALQGQARSASSNEDKLRLLVRAARLESRHRESNDEGLLLWQEALSAGLGREYYTRTNYLYEGPSFWNAVTALVEQSQSANADAIKARIAFYNTNDAEKARAYATAAQDTDMLGALDDLPEATENWRKFQRTLEQRYGDLGADEKARTVYLRMADLAAALADVDKEVDALRRLERQVDDDQVRNRLKVLYKRSEKWPMYVDLVKQEVESLGAERVEDKIDLLYEVIRVYRKEMKHDRMAINIYKEILAIDAADLDAIDQLVELYGEMNMSSDLINMLQTKAELVPGKRAKVEIYSQIAELFLEKFRNQAEAIKAYESVLEIEPFHGPAIQFLKEMYEKRRDWEKLIDVHKREIDTFETSEQRAAGYKEVAQLATDKLRKPEVATELWLKAREFAPDDRDALDALETLYEKNRDYEALADVLEHKVRLAASVDDKMKLLQKLGPLYSERLEDSARAIAAWKGAIALAPDDLKARKSLERLFIDNRDWSALEAFYAANDAHADLVRLLETLVSTMKEDEVKIELLLCAARIWRISLGDTARAERNLERVLGIDARNEGAAVQLEPIYTEAGDAKKLKDVLEIVLSHRTETAERRAYQLKLAQLHKGELSDWAGAFGWYADAFVEEPQSDEVIADLEAAAREAGTWDTLVKHYGDALGKELEIESVQKLRLRLGRVLSEELSRFDAALAQFEAVLAVEPDNLRALESMEHIYWESERWDDLMKVYRHRLNLEDNRDARVKILQGMATIAEQQAGDVESAIARYTEALELDGRNEETLRQLHRLYASNAQHSELAALIRREIDLVERRARLSARRPAAAAGVDLSGLVPERAQLAAQGSQSESGLQFFGGEGLDGPESLSEVLADLQESSAAEVAASGDEASEAQAVEAEAVAEVVDDLETVDLSSHPFYTEDEIEWLAQLRFELGVLCMRYLGAPDEAIDCLGLVLAWRPNNVDASAALESLLELDAQALRAAAILEPYYEVHGQWHEYVRTLDIQRVASENAVDRVSLLQRIGQTYLGELGDGVRSFETYAQVLEVDAQNLNARAQLRRIANALDMWEELVVCYETLLPSIGDEELRIAYLFALANMYANRLGDANKARDYFDEILKSRPDSMQALDDLEELFVSTEQWRELLSVYDRKLALVESADAIEELKFRKATIWEQLLDNAQEAITIYNEILETTPDNWRAVGALNDIFEAQQMWSELSANLERELELADAAAKNEVKNRLARVLEAHLGEPTRAVDLYEEVIEQQTDNAVAVAALEVLMFDERAPRGRISCILEPLYVDADDWAKLIPALDVQVQTSEEPDARVDLMHRIARLYEARAGSAADAFATYAKALRDDVHSERTLENLYRIAELTATQYELVAVFEDEAGFQANPDTKRDMLRRASAIYIDPLEQLDHATARLHEVLELFPADLETVEELEAIYRHTQQWEPLVAILVLKAELVDDEDAKKELLYQAGTLHEDVLEGLDDAIEVYNRVLAVDENDAHAIDRLEVLYTQLERWHDLLDIYRKKLELADNDEARKDLLYVMGAIFQEHLLDTQEAIETFRRILELDNQELAALEKLDGLYEQSAQWQELLETLEHELALTHIAEEAQNLKYRTGRLWEVHLGDALKGIEVYREVLLENPDHQATTEALEGLIERGEFEVEAAQVLQPIYQDSGQWEKLVHVHRLLIQATGDPERKLELYAEVGNIFEIRLMDLASAFQTYVEALTVDASRLEIVETLERLASELDGWEILIDRLDERLSEVSDFDVVAALNLRIARILEEELGDAPSAILRFQRVLEIDPTEASAILALDRLFQREGRWSELAEILRTRIMNTNEPDEALELRLRLGMLYQSALEEEDSAIDIYQTVLLDEPDNAQAIESLEQMFMAGQGVQRISDILEPYYLDKGQHEKLVEIYLQRLDLLSDPEERYDLLMQVARIFLHELQDAARAMQAYGAALIEKPGDEHVSDEIERLAGATVEWGQAAGFLAEALESQHITDESAMNLWLRLARILDEELEQLDDAELAYLKALGYDRGELRALESLDRIYLTQERWADLAEIIVRRVEGTFDEVDIVDLNYRLAQIYQNRLDEYERAVETYERILGIQPDHEDALRMLEQLHTERQSWPQLFEVLGRRAELTHDSDEQAHFFARMASLAEEMLGRRLDAVDLWVRVLDARSDDLDALRELRRLYMAEARWADLVSVLEREVELIFDEAERLTLFESLGTIFGEYLNNEGQALEAWQNVLLIDPEHLMALEALRDLCTRAGDYGELAGVLERLIEHRQIDDERKLELWIELGEVQGDMLMQPERAIHAWQNVLGLQPDNALAVDNLERLYIQESRWEEASQVLEVKADRSDDEAERIDIFMRIADMWETKILERDRAAGFYEQVLQLDPTNMQASRSLESIYVEQGSEDAFTSLASLYLDRAELVSEDVFERVETLRHAARIFEEHLQQPESALMVLLSAFSAETVDDAQLITDLERLARQTNNWDDVVSRFSEVLSELGDTLEAAALHRQVGQWRAEELGQLDDAVYHLQLALRIDSQSVEVIDLLEGLYRQLAMWPEMANILRSRVALAREPEERVDIWRKLGELYELQMGEIEDAIGAYRQILLIDESDLLAMESLERAFEAYDRWNDLVDILTAKAQATYDPEQLVEIKSRVADIWQQRLFDTDRAILAYQEVLAVDQTHEPALLALERLFMQVERWSDVVDVYEQRLALTHDPDAQVDLHGRLAAVYEEQFQDVDRAIDAYNSVLTIQVDNETAIQNLERLFAQMGRWFELVDVLQRHIEVVNFAEQRVALLRDLGRVQRDQVGDQHAAIEAFGKSLEIEPSQVDVWNELAALYEQTSNFESAIEAYRRLVDLADREDQQVTIYHRMGQIFESELHSDNDAEDAYQSALRIAPMHDEVLDAIAGVFERQQDWHGHIRVLKQAEGASRELKLKARYLCEVGQLYERRLDDMVSALRYYESALECDPQIVEAAAPLIDMYVNEKRWERAVPLLEVLIEELRGSGQDLEGLHRRHLQLALAYEHLSQIEHALGEYRNAYELKPTDVATLRGLGHLLFENNELEAASKVLQSLQLHHVDKLESDELVGVYFKLGAIRQKLGELRKANQFYEKALEVDQNHRPTLQALVDTHSEMGKWEEVIQYSRWALQTEQDATVRFAQLSKIGDLVASKLSQPERAVEAYVEALDIEPKSVVILRKLLDLYTKTKQWHESVQILMRIIEQESDAGRKSKYFYTAAVIFRDEIGDPLESVKLFDNALDTDVKMLKSFEAIDRILTQAKDWKELSRAYRRMLHRVGEHDDGTMEGIKTLLWQNLGEIYRTRLGDLKTATEAYKIAVGLNPSDSKIRLILAELYEKTGDNPDGAIEQHKELIKLDPFRVESYRVLFKSYIQKKEYDKAWCMSSALSFLQHASEQEEKFFRQYLGTNLQAAKGSFNQEMFKLLNHPEQDVLISYIMSILGQGLRSTYAQQIKVWNVHKKKDLLNIDEPVLFCKIYSYSARTMGLMPAPQVYLQAAQALGMRNANSDPPCVIIGGDVRQKSSDRELAFVVSKTLCWMLPQHYLGSVGYPTEVLKVYFLALMDLTDPSLGIGASLGEQGAEVKRQIMEIPAQMLMGAQKAMRQFLASGQNPNLSDWLVHCENTAIRMGLLLCGDIHQAASCIKNDVVPIGKATPKDKIREMVLFSISDEYFELRERLGLAIGK
ncbi:MAG: tetratricopeptide repeat protein, partial [Bradymonadaceae bacterium]|nr:tetratricopeptide repeat protein [Lujinxingiaceae bacterium]